MNSFGVAILLADTHHIFVASDEHVLVFKLRHQPSQWSVAANHLRWVKQEVILAMRLCPTKHSSVDEISPCFLSVTSAISQQCKWKSNFVSIAHLKWFYEPLNSPSGPIDGAATSVEHTINV